MGAVTLDDAIKDFFRQARISKRDGTKKLDDAWQEVVGEKFAKDSRPLSFDKTTLFVEVQSHAVWQELTTFKKQEILEKLRKLFPTKRITAVRCILKR
ncbi:DUF721 domain-containing protein [Candidatus Peregrinibacteria bacterium]|nr:DUF721 domain-containing protein [Candidatus Peregrinibacteria bacterium]